MVLVFAGIAAGLVASAPILATRAEKAQLSRGFAGLIFSFLFLSAVIFASRHAIVEAGAYMTFSVSGILSYLGFVLAAMLRGQYGRA